MAAQVEVQTGEVGRTVVGGRLHLSPLTDSSNSLIEINQSHIITPEPNKPVPGPKPRLTPKPFTVERNQTIKPIVAPKPQPKPRPESTRLPGYKPELPSGPKPQQPAGKPKPVSTNPNRPASTSYKTSNKLSTGQTTKPVAQPFKPAPPLDPGDPSKPSPPVPAERQKPAPSSLVYSKSLKKLPAAAAEWSGTTKREDEKDQVTSSKGGASITRAKSLGFLAQLSQEEEEKSKPEAAAVPLRPQPRGSRPRPVSAIFLDSPTKTETPVPATRWAGRRPLSADLTSKFESIGLSLHRKTPKVDMKENTPEEKKKESEKMPKSAMPHSSDGVTKPVISDQSSKKTEDMAVKETGEDKRSVSIKSRISLLLDSSTPTTTGSDLHSPVQPVPEAEPAVGVKQLIKQLTEDTTPTQSPVLKPPLKPRPLPLDLTKRFSSERSSDIGSVSVSEATDHHDISKDPQRRSEESAFSPSDQRTLVDVKDSQEPKKASTPEGPEAGQMFGTTSKESAPSGDVQTVRASLFDNVVERHSVLMVDESKPDKSKDSLSSPSFRRGTSEDDEGTLVTATYREPMSPSSPLRVLHAFDMVQAVEESRAVSENIPSAQREDKAMTLRSRRSEGSRTASAQSEPEQQPRYLRVGALQKWNTTGLEQGASTEKGMLRESRREDQVAFDKDREQEAAAPKRLKMLQAEEQPKPRATYFALTGQIQEPVSPVDAGVSSGDSQGKTPPVRRNPSLEEAFGKTSHDQVEELLMRSHMSHGEIRSALDRQTTEKTKLKELEREKQRQLDMEREAHLEFERMKEREMQREFERQRQRAFEKEKKEFEEKQRALERQKQMELEKQKFQELERERLEKERQRQLEKEKRRELERQRKTEKEKQERERQREQERQRQREEERQRELDKERQLLEIQKEKQIMEELERIKEMERQQLLEFQRQKQKEKERQQVLEMEKQRLREKKEREEAEKLKQIAVEQEMLRLKEKERQQLLEMEKQRLREKKEREEAEKLKQMAVEQEMLRLKEKERQQLLEMEKQRLREKKEREEAEKLKQMAVEQEMLRLKEKERQQLLEMEKQRLREKKEREEAEKLRQMAVEQEMLRLKELEKERERQKEMEKERQKEIEKEKQKELERQRQRDLERERQRQLDLERQELENQRLRQREQEKERQRKEELERIKEMERQRQREAEKQQILELEKRRLREKMEREEAEKIRQIAKQQEAERQRLKEKQKKEEQERARMETSPLRPKVVDLDAVLRNDPFSKATPPRSDPSTRWKEPSPRAEESYKLAILDIDSFTSQAQPSPSKDLFPVSGLQGVDTGFGARSQLTPERDVSWKVPPQNSGGVTAPVWTTSPQDPWELRPVEMSVDKPEPRKHANRVSPEQLLLRQEERLLAPQRPRSAVLDERLHLGLFSGGASDRAAAEQIWVPREPQDSRGDVRSHRRSHGSQELNRMRSRSVSRRSAPSSSAVEGSLSRMRSRSAHREQDRHSWVQQKQSTSGEEEGRDSETPVRDTDSQYGTWETGLRTDDSLTPATPSSESNLSPSPRKPTPPHTPGDAASRDTDTVDSLQPSSSSEIQTLSFPDAPATLLDTSALRSRAQLAKKRAPRTRPSRAARQSAALAEGGSTEDWLYRDSTEPKVESKADESDPEEQVRGADSGPAVSSQPQRIALFPGMDPSALKAQLKKRGDSDNQIDGPAPSPSQLSHSPKSPFLPRAARVLPPPGGKENGEEDSPQWLKELKSKKRLSHYENES